MLRLAPFIAAHSPFSRREAECALRAGKVILHGKTCTDYVAVDETPDSLLHGLTINGKALFSHEPMIWVFSKPRNVMVTRSDPEGRVTIFDCLNELRHSPIPKIERIVSVGRLDYSSQGLLLLTNRPEWAHMLEKSGVERVYHVWASGPLKKEDLRILERGARIDDMVYKPCHIEILEKRNSDRQIEHCLSITLTEGKNREIRILLEHIGLSVISLKRVSFGPFELGYVGYGDVRKASEREMLAFHRDICGIKTTQSRKLLSLSSEKKGTTTLHQKHIVSDKKRPETANHVYGVQQREKSGFVRVVRDDISTEKIRFTTKSKTNNSTTGPKRHETKPLVLKQKYESSRTYERNNSVEKIGISRQKTSLVNDKKDFYKKSITERPILHPRRRGYEDNNTMYNKDTYPERTTKRKDTISHIGEQGKQHKKSGAALRLQKSSLNTHSWDVMRVSSIGSMDEDVRNSRDNVRFGNMQRSGGYQSEATKRPRTTNSYQPETTKASRKSPTIHYQSDNKKRLSPQNAPRYQSEATKRPRTTTDYQPDTTKAPRRGPQNTIEYKSDTTKRLRQPEKSLSFKPNTPFFKRKSR